jgi:hypothetical protein
MDIKRLVLLAIVAAGAYQAWQHVASRSAAERLYDVPYVAVYGRDSCGWTQRMRGHLRAQGVDHHYFSVDDRALADGLHRRMERSGLHTGRYNLPVVDVNGSLSIRPDPGWVVSEYGARR